MSKEFVLSSKYFTNLRSAIVHYPIYRENKCSIVINRSFSIELPCVLAFSLSTKINEIIRNDPTINTFHININENNESSFKKIKEILTTGEQVTLDNEDYLVFAQFGHEIGNSDFIFPLNEELNNMSKSINNENVTIILDKKNKFNINDNEKETEYVSEHFEEMSTREDFINFCRISTNISIIEKIISSDKLSMDSEDTLLTFLLTIIEDNEKETAYYDLFRHVYLEYCSVDKCRLFV